MTVLFELQERIGLCLGWFTFNRICSAVALYTLKGYLLSLLSFMCKLRPRLGLDLEKHCGCLILSTFDDILQCMP